MMPDNGPIDITMNANAVASLFEKIGPAILETHSHSGGTLNAAGIPMAAFQRLTKISIIIYYGDNIFAKPMDNPGQDQWRIRLDMAKLWVTGSSMITAEMQPLSTCLKSAFMGIPISRYSWSSICLPIFLSGIF